MLFIVFLIGVLNLGVGFASAMYLGYGPPSLSAAWQALGGTARPISSVGAATTDGNADDKDYSDLSDLAFDENDLGSLLDLDDEEELLTESMCNDPAEESGDSTAVNAKEDDAEEKADPNSPENWELDDKNIETSVLKLNIAMMKSGVLALDLDNRLRSCRANPEAEFLRTIAARLKEDCETYLSEQEEASNKLRERLDEFGELKDVAEEIEFGGMEQAAQIETTLSNLNMLDVDSDPQAAHLRLLEELGNLREARHKLRDNRDVALLTIAQYEKRMDQIPKQLFNDELTGLRSRIGISAALAEWWSVSKHKKHQISAALFDLDGFGAINGKHGPAVADKVLTHVARLFEERCGTGDILGRFAGQRFLWVVADKGPRTATKDAEFVRQSLERTAYEHDGAEFGLTMCGGYTEIGQDDTVESFMARLEKALSQAKQAGSNHGSFHDGRNIELVESPNLGAKYREVKLNKRSTFPGK